MEKSGKKYELIYPGKESPEDIVRNINAAELKKIKTFNAPGDGWVNMLIRGDNLSTLKTLLSMKTEGRIKNSDGSIGARLIYIDPPFSTNLKFRGKKNQKAYDDNITGAEFIDSLRKRLILLREILSGNGSIYVHLDWKMAHYVKAVMDEIFGEENFLNDIIWNYGGRGAKAVAGQFSRNHDIILLYRKSGHIFNRTSTGKRILKSEAGSNGIKKDVEGRWFKTSPRGDYTDGSIAELSKEGRVYRTRTGNVRIKYFLKEDGDYLIEEKLVGDVWDDIPDAMHLPATEKTGYPTQKPEALLRRIIMTSSGPGDIVLDAFAGSGTALAAAEKLQRRWIGLDSGRLSIHTAQERLLTIKGTRALEGPGKKYPRTPNPFAIYSAGDREGIRPHAVSLSAFTDPKDKEVYVIKIERFSSPDAAGAAGLEALSSVSIDYDFDGAVFNVHEIYRADELRKNGYEIRLQARHFNQKRGLLTMALSDISGNELVKSLKITKNY